MSDFKHIGLFEGIGGFSLAARWAGWETIAWCEWNEFGQRNLRYHFPEAEGFGDITKTDFTKYANKIDILTGGFPCQPFSIAGQRKGKDDDRYLWEEMLRVIATIKPTYVVGENVTGIIGLALDTVLSDLEAQNYTTETFIIPACSKNAWHRRDRVWIVAYANSIGRQDEQKENGKSLCNGERNNTIEEQGRKQQQCRIGKSSSVFSNTTSSGTGMEEYRSSGQERGASNEHQPTFLRQKNRKAGSKRFNASSGDVSSKTNDTGCEEQRQPITDGAELFAPKCSSWWETEPGVGRVVDGLPGRVDRLKGLGNSIVPQVAYEIFSAIGAVSWHGA